MISPCDVLLSNYVVASLALQFGVLHWLLNRRGQFEISGAQASPYKYYSATQVVFSTSSLSPLHNYTPMSEAPVSTPPATVDLTDIQGDVMFVVFLFAF